MTYALQKLEIPPTNTTPPKVTIKAPARPRPATRRCCVTPSLTTSAEGEAGSLLLRVIPPSPPPPDRAPDPPVPQSPTSWGRLPRRLWSTSPGSPSTRAQSSRGTCMPPCRAPTPTAPRMPPAPLRPERWQCSRIRREPPCSTWRPGRGTGRVTFRIVVDDPRAVLGTVASLVYGTGSLPFPVVGVTGTNGKTTTAYLISSALEALGQRTGLIGTVETRIGDERVQSRAHHPGGSDLHALLAVMRSAAWTPASWRSPATRWRCTGSTGSVYDVAAVHEPLPGPPRLPCGHARVLPGQGLVVHARALPPRRGLRRRRVGPGLAAGGDRPVVTLASLPDGPRPTGG